MNIMKDFRIWKLLGTILLPSRLSKADAKVLTQSLEIETNWNKEFNY